MRSMYERKLLKILWNYYQIVVNLLYTVGKNGQSIVRVLCANCVDIDDKIADGICEAGYSSARLRTYVRVCVCVCVCNNFAGPYLLNEHAYKDDIEQCWPPLGEVHPLWPWPNLHIN